MNSRPSFRIVPLPLSLVSEARRTLTDCAGHALRPHIETAGGNPCRFTLRLTRPGEEVILMSCSPFRTEQPYRETGPVFILAQGDTGYTDIHRFPSGINPLTRVFRCYDAAERIIDARVGTAEPEQLIAELFAKPRVDCIHVRSLTYGCYTFRIERV